MSDSIGLEDLGALIADNHWDLVARYFSDRPLSRALGVQVSLADPEQPRCSIDEPGDLHLGGIGRDFVNGAILAALVDLTIGLIGLRRTGTLEFATSSINIELAKPVRNGPFSVVASHSETIGRRIFAEAKIFDKDEIPCVFATGIVTTGIRHR